MSDAASTATTLLSQPRRGYRFSADAVALAEFAQASPVETVLDLCTGCGVIPILMWQRSPFLYGVGVELDAELANLARYNVAQFRLQDRIHMIQADIRLLRLEDLKNISPLVLSNRFDVITANPPYWSAYRGRLNPNLQKAAARHEISLTLAEVLAAARRFLEPGGRIYLSHLESRQNEVLESLEREHLVVRQTRYLSGRTGRLLLEADLRGDRVQVSA
ncbi:MAG: methyltransferase domain-containing protein [Acidobacteria bacterium]|nr:methyltransferase domain-containing protein [Acidobacteriota bacterium]